MSDCQLQLSTTISAKRNFVHGSLSCHSTKFALLMNVLASASLLCHCDYHLNAGLELKAVDYVYVIDRMNLNRRLLINSITMGTHESSPLDGSLQHCREEGSSLAQFWIVIANQDLMTELPLYSRHFCSIKNDYVKCLVLFLLLLMCSFFFLFSYVNQIILIYILIPVFHCSISSTFCLLASTGVDS